MTDDCVFCQIVDGELPAHIVYEDEKTVAFLDSKPVSEGHTLVVPKKHVETIFDAGEMNYMWSSIVRVAKAVLEALDPEGVNIDQNNGEAAGQEVPHMHFHVTPRYTGEEIELEYDRKELERGEEIADEIGSQIT